VPEEHCQPGEAEPAWESRAPAMTVVSHLGSQLVLLLMMAVQRSLELSPALSDETEKAGQLKTRSGTRLINAKKGVQPNLINPIR
jgi:hypothetical protein